MRGQKQKTINTNLHRLLLINAQTLHYPENLFIKFSHLGIVANDGGGRSGVGVALFQLHPAVCTDLNNAVSLCRFKHKHSTYQVLTLCERPKVTLEHEAKIYVCVCLSAYQTTRNIIIIMCHEN